MTKKAKKSTNDDILSGKGLKPLPSSKPSSELPGINTEKREKKCPGIREDKFTKKTKVMITKYYFKIA
ncbi:hypothetical protein [Ruminococcus callidus]|jgi:hypothetical protein|uniref:hypothetical protein n=1 Tax=Ruminococcus callidus TaxID=40519 RepID=UPI0023F14EB3|nr:hypothetical protein [Ruminococcus callidus]